MSDSITPWTTTCQASLPITISQSLLKLMSVESVMPLNHIILCYPLLLLPSIFPSISLFQWVGSLNQVAKVSELQLQHQSFQWRLIQSWFPLGLTGLISLLSKGLSRVFSSITVQKHQFFSAQPYLQRRQWHPTPVLLLGKSHGRRNLVGCSPWGR